MGRILFAAIQTLLNGGAVYVVEPKKMPDTSSIFEHLRQELQEDSAKASLNRWRAHP
jgi:hypothetical protein